MDRNEFVSTLRGTLAGEVPDNVMQDNVRYYENYISQEIAAGRTEEEVLAALGDPRLIAKTIIDTQGSEKTYRDAYFTAEDPDREKGLHAEMNENGGIDIKYKRFNFNTWYGKLLVILVLVLILVIVLTVVGKILSWVLPVLIPVVVILFLIEFFFGGRR